MNYFWFYVFLIVRIAITRIKRCVHVVIKRIEIYSNVRNVIDTGIQNVRTWDRNRTKSGTATIVLKVEISDVEIKVNSCGWFIYIVSWALSNSLHLRINSMITSTNSWWIGQWRRNSIKNTENEWSGWRAAFITATSRSITANKSTIE